MRDIAMFPMIIFLSVILPSSSFSLWEQIQDPAGSSSSSSHSSPVENNAGVSGGFWGSLLGHGQKGGGEQNTFRNSQRNRQIEAAENKRQTLPSSLRSIHTLQTEYEDSEGEMFMPEESRTEQLINTRPHQ